MAALCPGFHTWPCPKSGWKLMSAADGRNHFQHSVLHTIPNTSRPFRSALRYQHFTAPKLLPTMHSWGRSQVTSAKFPFSLQALIPSSAPFPSWAGNRVQPKCSAQGFGVFANAALSHLIISQLGLAGLTDIGTKLTHLNRRVAQRKVFLANSESIYKYVATVLNTNWHHGLTALRDYTTVTMFFYLPQLNGDSKEGVSSQDKLAAEIPYLPIK